jgi:endonuclease III
MVANRRYPTVTAILQQQAREVLAVLKQSYPEARCALVYHSPWELLVATILSAQCTDVRVNQVTPLLFRRYPGPQQMATASPEELAEVIRSTGFFRNKAKNLQQCAEMVVRRFSGEVPQQLSALVQLPGVGRKTANVVLGNAFATPGMVVDTHVKRISRRLGWSRHEDPVKIEADLCRLLPRDKWTQAAHTLIFHGRAVCKAPVPRCSVCPVTEHCPRIGVTRSR